MMQRIEVVAAVIVEHGPDGLPRVLMTQRPSSCAHPLHWECPGGKVEPGESLTDALHRELDEELGMPIIVGRRVFTAHLIDANGDPTIDVHFMRCMRLAPRKALELREVVGAGWWVWSEAALMPKITPGNSLLFDHFDERGRFDSMTFDPTKGK